MPTTPKSFDRLVAELEKLPGIGAKTAARLAFYLLRTPREEAENLADAIRSAREAVRRCSVCGTLTEEDPCAICTDPGRNPAVVCVVEEPGNIATIEKTREYRGRYHVLWGSLSPLRGVGPDDIDVAGLLRRLDGTVREVIVATNPTVEGETTALYLARAIKPLGVRVSRIALGLPVGGDLEYADEVTMAQSLSNRREL
jgi:recombination protein RecR